MSSQTLNTIFEKLHSADKDYRFMATSDLLTELQKESIRMDAETEKRVCKYVLQKMKDVAGDISEIADKCLAALIPKIQDNQIGEICSTLCEQFLSSKKEDIDSIDIANTGLKIVIWNVDKDISAADIVVKKITLNMIDGTKSQSNEMAIQSLDILYELITKFGSKMDSYTQVLINMLTSKLDDNRTSMKKKAINCLSVLSIYLTDGQLDALCTFMYDRISKSNSPSISACVIQAVGMIVMEVGYRLSKYIEPFTNLAFEKMDRASEEDIELIEVCIRTIERFVVRCPLKIKNSLDKILDVCSKFLRYDPNYTENIDDMEVDKMTQTEDEEGEEQGEYEELSSDKEYSDDDDESWKLRKAAASCFLAVFKNNYEHIEHIYEKVGPILVDRFSEREETVRIDVIDAYCNLIKQIKKKTKSYDSSNVTNILDSGFANLMKAVSKQLKDKSIKAKINCFKLLCELVVIMPNQVNDYIPNFTTSINKSLMDKATSSDLKIEILFFLRKSMSSCPSDGFKQVLPKISDAIFEMMKERYYKVTAEALRVCVEIVKLIRRDATSKIDDDFMPIVKALVSCTMDRLSAQDIDQEVKECAIICIGESVATLGDVITKNISEIFNILLDRLRSETTRFTTVKALRTIASSPLPLNLSQIAEPVIIELTMFLRKANVNLRQASLKALSVFCQKTGFSLNPAVLSKVIEEARVFLDDKDLHLTSHAISLIIIVMKAQPESIPEISKIVVPITLKLVSSPLLQGATLKSLQSFFACVVASGDSGIDFNTLLNALLQTSQSKGQHLGIAKCIASVCCEGRPDMIEPTVKRLISMIQSVRELPDSQHLAVFCLGELGRNTDLYSLGGVESVLSACLEHSLDDMRIAASYSLGALTVGNISKFLPVLLNKIKVCRAEGKPIYLILQSLNEAISSVQKSNMARLTESEIQNVLELLLLITDTEEDSLNVIAECLGQLALLHPKLVLPELLSHVSDASASMRYTIIFSIKNTIVERQHPVDQILREQIPLYLKHLTDEDRHVRKAVIKLFCSILTHKFSLIEGSLDAVLPHYYEQTLKREDLIRILDFGPFKHRIDDGLELRKAAVEGMNLLLEVCPTLIDLNEFVTHLLSSLNDVEDIQLLCHPMLVKLCFLAESIVLGVLDKLVEPLYIIIFKTVKIDTIKQEQEKHNTLVSSCLRAADALNQLPGISSNTSFKRLIESINMKEETKKSFKSIVQERIDAESQTKITGHGSSSVLYTKVIGKQGSL